MCIDVQTPELESTTKSVKEVGAGDAFYYQCDVTDKDQVDQTIETIEKDIGDITMLYHCCSLPSPRAVVNNPPSVKQTIDISVTSYFYVSFSSFSFISGTLMWTFVEIFLISDLAFLSTKKDKTD